MISARPLVCIVAVATVVMCSSCELPSSSAQRTARQRASEEVGIADDMKPKVLAMIRHAFNSYTSAAFPHDEVRPIQGTGHDTLGAYALTLVDSLDVLAIAGLHEEFRYYSHWVQEHVSFDVDKEVSVFETSIRILGGLLSAHFMYEEEIVAIDEDVDAYDGGLLRLAVDLGERLLPAFATPTGIPYGTVNLKNGVPKGEIDVTSTAGGGTFILEMTILSAVTGNPAFEAAARKATLALVRHRVSSTNLVGNHINITSGQWTLELSSVGSGIDSLIEYLIKGYAFTGDPELFKGYRILREAFSRHTRRGPWFMEMNAHGPLMNPLHNSLASFYPGNIAFSGMDVEEAVETCLATHFIVKKLGAMPEGYHLGGNAVQSGQQGYPLRPEHAESIYMLYRLTGDKTFLEMGKEFALTLWTRTATRCGFAALSDCTLPPSDNKYSDAMESFVLSETLKYLFLLFDEDNILHASYLPIIGEQGSVNNEEEAVSSWVFNTEGHPLPVRQEWRWWRLLEEHQTSREQTEGRQPDGNGGGDAHHDLSQQIDEGDMNHNGEGRYPPRRSFVTRIRESLRPTDPQILASQRWMKEKEQREERFDKLEQQYDKEYAAWSRFNGHIACGNGNYRCLFDPLVVPRSSPLPHHSIDVSRTGQNGFVYRLHDDVEVMDTSFHCAGRQARNDFSRLPKALYFEQYDS
jgi:ER degradation enhancer, mannosidase alpha-like 2